MIIEETYAKSKPTLALKISDYVQLIKFRLASLVVFSAAVCYAFAAIDFSWTRLLFLVIGGFLVTGSSNAFNQIIEKDLDKLMDRTSKRPLASGRMGIAEALILSTIMGIAGILILWFYINPMSGFLGGSALVLYTLVYTPLKRVTPFAVFVGAFPGAIPPLLGCVAATGGQGSITLASILLFGVQFLWQFPHFWAIAWVLDDDYKKAGFQMLPSDGGRDKSSAFQVVVYTLSLLPVCLLPFAFHLTGSFSAIVAAVCSILFLIQAINLYRTCSLKSAQQLMFGSFIYLPVVQIAYLLDKI